MILNRFTKQVKEENWFAITLEFFVVVIGIFMGLQVEGWNEERKERIEEAQYIERLHRDMAAQLADMSIRVDYFKVAQEDNQLVLDYIQNKLENQPSAGRLLAAFYNSTVIYPFNPFSITFQEIFNNR